MPPHARCAGERLARYGHLASRAQFAEACQLPVFPAAQVDPLIRTLTR